jgi:orotate phosphoribosyltransferase
MAEGARVLLVEDLASEGTSKLNFVQGIRNAGGIVHHSFVIFHYGIFPQSVTSLAAEQVKLLALATWWDAIEIAEGLGYFTPPQLASVRAFLENPDAWSAAHAAKAKA